MPVLTNRVPRSSLRVPDGRSQVPDLVQRYQVPGPTYESRVQCPQVKGSRWRILSPGSHVWIPGHSFVVCQVSQNSQGNTKKQILAQMFSESCKISNNTFFKEPFGRLLLHKPLLCLLSHQDSLAEYFFCFIWRLRTKLKPIFQILSQKPIFNSVEHLPWSFFSKMVNILKLLSIFEKKVHCRCSDRF